MCEVVLYSDVHESTLATLPESRIRNLIDVWADRYEELGALDFVDYVFIFENKGEAIGVTLHHPHGQIYAYPFVPPRPRTELEAARAYRAENDGRCLHCDILAEELEDGRRVVVEGDHFAAFVPFYAHFPYEAHVYARRCAPSIAELTPEERGDLARVLKRLLAGYDGLFGFSLPYMMVMHQAPTDGGRPRRRGPLPHRVLPAQPHRRQAQVPGRERDRGGGVRHGRPTRGDRRLPSRGRSRRCG